MSELVPLWREKADDIVEKAYDTYKPRKVFALFSGGNDSTVLVDWASRKLLTYRPLLDAAVHIDTGTALPGVREFVEGFCADRKIPLIVLEAGDAYERMLLEGYAADGLRPGERPPGFPGPAGHKYAYVRLKERQIRELVRDHKKQASDHIMLLTGGRRAESQRRTANFSESIQKEGAKVWVAPLIDWLNQDMQDYRDRWNVRQSDVAALIHRSGECNCGAFATPGERKMVCQFFPEFKEWVEGLEAKCRAANAINCEWGVRPPELVESAGPMCSQCQTSLLDLEEAA